LLVQQGLPSYVAGTSTFHVTITSNQVQEINGTRAELNVTTREVVTLALGARSRDSLSLLVTLDSITEAASGPTTRDNSLLAGLRVRGMLSPAGAVYSAVVSAPAGQESNTNISERLRQFLPRIKPGATQNSSWTDTLRSSFSPGLGTTLTRTLALTYAVLGDTVIGGRAAWRLRAVSTANVTGTVVQGASPYQVKGTGTGEGMAYLGKDGVYLGQNATEEQSLIISSAQGDFSFPVTTKTTTTVTRIR
jgi:hypothetical protein